MLLPDESMLNFSFMPQLQLKLLNSSKHKQNYDYAKLYMSAAAFNFNNTQNVSVYK